MMKFDYLIVGAGFYGATCARLLAENNYKCVVVDTMNKVGGHASTSIKDGIIIHDCGPHIFHTNNDEVWEFVNRFDIFDKFDLKVRVNYHGQIYSFPINLLTLQQIFGGNSYQETMQRWELTKIPCKNPQSFEEAALASVGETLYEIFFLGYTKKQWQQYPSELPASIFNRLPVRNTYDDSYFNKHRNKYQGIPRNGYTKLVENMLDHPNITVKLNFDFFETLSLFSTKNFEFHNLIFTGPIDKLFDYKYGRLPYRSLKFDIQRFEDTFQGGPVINYTDASVPYTRTTEHKFFMPEPEKIKHSYVSFEYPASYEETNEPYYPINTPQNNELFKKYEKLALQYNASDFGGLSKDKLYIGGRLGQYKYFDMDQTIEHAFQLAGKIINERNIYSSGMLR